MTKRTEDWGGMKLYIGGQSPSLRADSLLRVSNSFYGKFTAGLRMAFKTPFRGSRRSCNLLVLHESKVRQQVF